MASQKLDTLINEIKKLDLDELSETRIKQGVISRILNGLGWDTFNISEVIMEHSVGTMRVDYALHISNDKKVFIEAKSGSEKLENHQEQLLNYSFKEGVRLSILTNGETWWFYLPLESGNWEHRRFYSINIKGQSTEVISRKFIDFLAKEKVEDGTAIENAETALKSRKRKDTVSKTLPTAWERIITEPDELLVELLLDKTEEICGYRPDSKEVQDFLKTISFEEKKKPHQPEKIKIKKPYKPKKDDVKLHEFSGSKEFILEDLAKIDDPDLLYDMFNHTKPDKLIIKGNVFTPKHWSDADVYFVKWLVDNGHLLKSNMPIYNHTGENKYFINTEKKHESPIYIDAIWKPVGDFYVDVKYNSDKHILNYYHTLEHLDLEDLSRKISLTVK